jgi:hypothetical protein
MVLGAQGFSGTEQVKLRSSLQSRSDFLLPVGRTLDVK